MVEVVYIVLFVDTSCGRQRVDSVYKEEDQAYKRACALFDGKVLVKAFSDEHIKKSR